MSVGGTWDPEPRTSHRRTVLVGSYVARSDYRIITFITPCLVRVRVAQTGTKRYDDCSTLERLRVT
eukprot:scaffold567099_cov18-Prasinocladus_malaysianus.AAC.1